MDLNKVTDKLKKLKAHAESAQKIGNEAEAQAFAMKVQELLSQYKLSMSEIDWNERDDNDPIDQESIDYGKYDIPYKESRVLWQEDLCRIIGKAYHCGILISSHSNSLWLVGRQSDRAVAEFMFVTIYRFLRNLSKREGRKHRIEARRAGAAFIAYGWEESFRYGFISRLSERFEEEFRKVQSTDNSTSIIRLTNAIKEVDQWMSNQRYGSVKNKRSWNQKNSGGYDAGKNAANDIDLKKKAVEAGSNRPNGLLDR
jgi:Protein of unknown function (DUF2786)